MKYYLAVASAILFCSLSSAQIPFDGQDNYYTPPLGYGAKVYENPLITSIAREPYSATSISFPTREQALDVRVEKSDRYLSLDGEWDFFFSEEWIEEDIPEWLDGKTIKPNLNYAYDWVASLNDGRGEFTPSANFGIDNIGKGTAYGQWTQELYDALNKSSITFTYNKDNDVLTATSVDNGTNKGNITVTVDDTNKTLQFSENPLTYNWLFTNNTEAKWQLVVKREDCLFTMTNLGSVTTKELFANNEVHMSYYSSSDSKYLVINYVLQNDATNEQ